MINKDFKSILSKVKENRKFLLTIQLVERKSKENLEIKLSEEEILNKYHEDIKKVIEEHKNLCLNNDNEISDLILKAEQGLKDKESSDNNQISALISNVEKTLSRIDVKNL
jgi:3-isopropylmalate dehydratase small subunit